MIRYNKIVLLALSGLFCLALTGCDPASPTEKITDKVPPPTTTVNKPEYSIAIGGNSNGKVVVAGTGINYEKPKVSFLNRLAAAFSSSSIEASNDQPIISSAQAQKIFDLPSDIKRIKVLDSNRILYIKSTDQYDRAKELVLKDIKSNTETTLYAPSDGFAIDEMVISPDQTLIALWEVKPKQDSPQLLGGESRVTELKFDKTSRILFSQKTTEESGDTLASLQDSLSPKACVQYPLFYDAKNRLFLDTFCPNGGGWGNGIYTISPQTNSLTPYSALPAGSYSSDPTAAANGNYFAVILSDKKYSQDRNGVSSAQDNPQTLGIFSTASDLQEKVPLKAGWTVYHPIVSQNGRYICYLGFSSKDGYKNGEDGSIYIYDQNDKTTREIPAKDYVPIEFGENDSSLILGKIDPTAISDKDNKLTVIAANLGESYAPIYEKYLIADINDLGKTVEYTPPAFSEYINQGWRLSARLKDEKAITPNLKIDFLEMRGTELAKNRLAAQQQSNVPNVNKRSGAVGPAGQPTCATLADQMNLNIITVKDIYLNSGKCFDSPLYLYPAKNMEVSIKSDVPVYNSEPPSAGGGWQVTASSNGTISSNGQNYSKISYDYASSVEAPQTGILVSNDNLRPALSDYAFKLGLNEREKNDFISFWFDKLHNSAPLYQISHYFRAESAEILKLNINPTPDTFIPIVMYFKKLTFPTVLPAERFEPILPRAGFTALDWSGIVE